MYLPSIGITMVSVICVIAINNILTWYRYHDGKREVTMTMEYRYISINNVQIASKKDVFNCE